MILLWLLACAAEPVGDSAAPACDPQVTWETFGRGFLTQHCDACHAASAADRRGAPASVTFDTEAEVEAWADAILARAAGPDADMPPRGGVSEDDRVLLERWLCR